MTNFSRNIGDIIEIIHSSGALSKTGSGRFDGLIAAISAHLGMAAEDIYVVACARPNNLNIRLTQGRAQHRHFKIGLGIIPDAPDPAKIINSGLKAGASFIGAGRAQYDAVGIVVKTASGWTIGGVVEAEGAGIASALFNDFPEMQVKTVLPQPAPQAAMPAPSVAGGSGSVNTLAMISPGPAISTSTLPKSDPEPGVSSAPDLSEFVASFRADLVRAKLVFADDLIVRFCASLLARRFLVLSGLSGSGKTKLVQAFATWLTPPAADNATPYTCIVAVGADWTNNENILGFADGLDATRYETKPSIELVIAANERKNIPHMLILDEMNLSHVERYFADFLSGMETGTPVILYRGAARGLIPKEIALPKNLFVAGTVNVDETTYLFSPKVLDRANVIEFRADEDEVFGYLESFEAVCLDALLGLGARFMVPFLTAASSEPQLQDEDKAAVGEAFRRVFRIMSCFGREFGFRTLRDVARYVYFHRQLVGDTAWEVDDAIDAQIYQRVLPKIHGSRAQVQMLLWALGMLCLRDDLSDAALESEIVGPLTKGGGLKNPFDDAKIEGMISSGFATAKYPMSCSKIYRMQRQLKDGFTSFMEA